MEWDRSDSIDSGIVTYLPTYLPTLQARGSQGTQPIADWPSREPNDSASTVVYESDGLICRNFLRLKKDGTCLKTRGA